jgi:hypothetical protein
MSGDQERDAPKQHPTERESFEAWYEEAYPDYIHSDLGFDCWQAGRKPLLEEIEKLRAELAVYKDMKPVAWRCVARPYTDTYSTEPKGKGFKNTPLFTHPKKKTE